MNDTKLLRTESRSLPVKLTHDELRDRGDKLAAVIQDVNAEERRQVDLKTQMKARITELGARQTQLAIVISRREEDREVPVDIYADYERMIVDTVRRDTGETVGTRKMTEDERQRALPMPV